MRQQAAMQEMLSQQLQPGSNNALASLLKS